jgi:transcriptional regulator with XRE-family HTH domain
MTSNNGRAFNEWLRAQLKAKKMSQRQLAQQSGVDHSTISRLIRGDRMPSLGTATKLARGLREIREDADTPQYLGLVTSGSANPTARVEYALRADEALGEPQVRQIMEYYLAVRMRRFGRVFHAADHAPSGANGNGQGHANGSGTGPNGTNGSNLGASSATGGRVATGSRPSPLPSGRPTSYTSQSSAPSLMPRVGIATRVTSTPTLTRPTGRSSDRY